MIYGFIHAPRPIITHRFSRSFIILVNSMRFEVFWDEIEFWWETSLPFCRLNASVNTFRIILFLSRMRLELQTQACVEVERQRCKDVDIFFCKRRPFSSRFWPCFHEKPVSEYTRLDEQERGCKDERQRNSEYDQALSTLNRLDPNIVSWLAWGSMV